MAASRTRVKNDAATNRHIIRPEPESPTPIGQDRRRGDARTAEYYAPVPGIRAEESLGHRGGLLRGLSRMLEVNFRECPKGEVLRIPIPRTSVNKRKKKGAESRRTPARC